MIHNCGKYILRAFGTFSRSAFVWRVSDYLRLMSFAHYVEVVKVA